MTRALRLPPSTITRESISINGPTLSPSPPLIDLLISSKISVVNNIYDGKILLDISKSKDSELLKKFNIDLNKIKYYLVTDNLDDLRYARNSLKTLFILKRKNSILCKDLLNVPNVQFVFR